MKEKCVVKACEETGVPDAEIGFFVCSAHLRELGNKLGAGLFAEDDDDDEGGW